MADEHALELIDLRREFAEKVAVDDIVVARPGRVVLRRGRSERRRQDDRAVDGRRAAAARRRARRGCSGIDVWRDPIGAKARARACCPTGSRCPERLTGGELLTYWGRLRGLPRGRRRRAHRRAAAVLELDEAERGTLVVEYSTGMRKKIGLATALLHAPQRARARRAVRGGRPGLGARCSRAILRRFAAGGGAVVISSHVMALVEQLCDHVAIVARGQVRGRRHPRRGAGRRARSRTGSSSWSAHPRSTRRSSHGSRADLAEVHDAPEHHAGAAQGGLGRSARVAVLATWAVAVLASGGPGARVGADPRARAVGPRGRDRARC